MNTTQRILLAVVAAALIVAVVFTRGFGLWAPTQSGALTLYGNVDIREVDLGFRVAGRIADIAYEEGDRTAAGAVLARLDVRPLATHLAAAEASVAAAQAELAKRVSGARPQEIAGAEADLAQRRATLAGAQADYDRRLSLIGSGAISQALVDQTQATLHADQAQTHAAEEALSLQKAGSRREDIDAARAQLATAIANRDAARVDLEDAVLYAPAAGVLSTRAREPGAIVAPGETVFTLTIDRPVRVRAYVAEPDLGRVRPGQAVTVTADGVAKTYHGVIGYVSPSAEFTPKTVETRSLRADLVYRLRVVVGDPDDALRQGQPVTVSVAAGGQ